ncbi:MAG: 30S ribosomal protein S19 [Thaumarchaeota archaeon]|nr:30S ribosomal protein S19 [Nitrososphaerota archaeon]
MPKEFKYRGFSLEQLQGMSFESFLGLLPSRQRRSLNRGMLNSDDKKKFIADTRLAKDGKIKNPIKTHARDMVILPYMVALTIQVHSGKEFVPLEIKPEMVGHYIGEYVITNKKVVHGTPGIGASRSSLYVPLK